jgi:hypothetical protein
MMKVLSRAKRTITHSRWVQTAATMKAVQLLTIGPVPIKIIRSPSWKTLALLIAKLDSLVLIHSRRLCNRAGNRMLISLLEIILYQNKKKVSMSWSSKLKRGKKTSASLMLLVKEPSKLKTLKIQYQKKKIRICLKWRHKVPRAHSIEVHRWAVKNLLQRTRLAKLAKVQQHHRTPSRMLWKLLIPLKTVLLVVRIIKLRLNIQAAEM